MNNKYSLTLDDRNCIEKFLRMQLRKKKDNSSEIQINHISLAVARILSLYKGITIDKDLIFNISVHRNWKVLHKNGIFEVLGKTNNNESRLEGIVKHRTGEKWMIIKDGVSYNVPLPSCMRNKPPSQWYPYIQYLTSRALIVSLQYNSDPTEFNFTFDSDVTKYIPFYTYNSLAPRTNIASILLDFINSWIISFSYIQNIIKKSNIILYFSTNAAVHNKGDYNEHQATVYNELFLLLSKFNQFAQPNNNDIYIEIIRVNIFQNNELRIRKLIDKIKQVLAEIISFFFDNIHGVYEAYMHDDVANNDKFKLSSYLKKQNNTSLTDKDDYDLLLKMDDSKKNMLPVTFDFYIYNNEYTSLLYNEYIAKQTPRNDNIPCILIHSTRTFKSELKIHKHKSYYDALSESVIHHHAVISKVMKHNQDKFSLIISEDISYLYNKKLSSLKNDDYVIKSLYPFQSDIDLFMFHSFILPHNKEQDIHTRLIIPGSILTTPSPHINNKNKGILYLGNNHKDENTEDFRSFCNFTDINDIAPVFGTTNIVYNYRMQFVSEENFRNNPLHYPVNVDFPNTYSKIKPMTERRNNELKTIGISVNDSATISRLQSYNANTSISNPLLRILHRLYPNTIKRYSPCINYATISILSKKHLIDPIDTFGSLDVLTMECLIYYAFAPVFMGCISTARDALDQVLTSCDASFFTIHFLSLKLRLKDILINRSPLVALSTLLERKTLLKNKLTVIHIFRTLIDCFLIPARNHLLKHQYGQIIITDKNHSLKLNTISKQIQKQLVDLLCQKEVSVNIGNLNTPILHLHCAIRSLADSIHVLQGNLLPSYNKQLPDTIVNMFPININIHIAQQNITTENNEITNNAAQLRNVNASFFMNKMTSESKHNQISLSHHYYIANMSFVEDEKNNNHIRNGIKYLVQQYLCLERKPNNLQQPRIFYTCIHGVLFGTRSLYKKSDHRALNIQSCINLSSKSNSLWELFSKSKEGYLDLETDAINLKLMNTKSLERYFFFHKYRYNDVNKRFELQ